MEAASRRPTTQIETQIRGTIQTARAARVPQGHVTSAPATRPAGTEHVGHKNHYNHAQPRLGHKPTYSASPQPLQHFCRPVTAPNRADHQTLACRTTALSARHQTLPDSVDRHKHQKLWSHTQSRRTHNNTSIQVRYSIGDLKTAIGYKTLQPFWPLANLSL